MNMIMRTSSAGNGGMRIGDLRCWSLGLSTSKSIDQFSWWRCNSGDNWDGQEVNSQCWNCELFNCEPFNINTTTLEWV